MSTKKSISRALVYIFFAFNAFLIILDVCLLFEYKLLEQKIALFKSMLGM